MPLRVWPRRRSCIKPRSRTSLTHLTFKVVLRIPGCWCPLITSSTHFSAYANAFCLTREFPHFLFLLLRLVWTVSQFSLAFPQQRASLIVSFPWNYSGKLKKLLFKKSSQCYCFKVTSAPWHRPSEKPDTFTQWLSSPRSSKPFPAALWQWSPPP